MKSKKLFYIGLSAILTTLILVFGIEFLKGINIFHGSNYYFASLESVEGLNVSAPVTTSGFKVGQVRQMEYEFDNPGHIRIELALDSKLVVPEGTEAEIVTDLLGTASINLVMPKSGTPLPKGTVLPSRKNPGLVDGLKEELMPSISSVMPKIDSLLLALTTVVTDPAITATLQRIDEMSRQLQKASADLATSCAALPPMFRQASDVMTNVDHIAANLDTLSVTLAALPLEQTMANIETLSADLKNVGSQLRDPSSSLGMLIYDPALYNNLTNTAASLDSLVVDLKAHPKRYLKFSVF